MRAIWGRSRAIRSAPMYRWPSTGRARSRPRGRARRSSPAISTDRSTSCWAVSTPNPKSARTAITSTTSGWTTPARSSGHSRHSGQGHRHPTSRRRCTGTTRPTSNWKASASSAKSMSTSPTGSSSRAASATMTTARALPRGRPTQASSIPSAMANRSRRHSSEASMRTPGHPGTSCCSNAKSVSTRLPGARSSTSRSRPTTISISPIRAATSRAGSTRRCHRSSRFPKASIRRRSTLSKSVRRTVS